MTIAKAKAVSGLQRVLKNSVKLNCDSHIGNSAGKVGQKYDT